MQQRKRLPDLKTKNTTQLSVSMTIQNQALLTPDGKYYLSSTVCEDAHSVDTMVWDTATGKKRKLPQSSPGNMPGNLVYSKGLKCLVTSYQHPSGLSSMLPMLDVNHQIMEGCNHITFAFIHSKKKKYFHTTFWRFSLSQIGSF